MSRHLSMSVFTVASTLPTATLAASASAAPPVAPESAIAITVDGNVVLLANPADLLGR